MASGKIWLGIKRREIWIIPTSIGLIKMDTELNWESIGEKTPKQKIFKYSMN